GPVELVCLYSNLMVGAETMLGLQVEGTSTLRLHCESQEKRMDLHLGGKIAVVTGASKGIGWAITRALVGEGATVVAGARSSATDLPALEADGSVVFVPVDLTTTAGPNELVARAADLGGIDILINNA